MRGDPDTEISLTILKKGTSEVIDLNLTRQLVKVSSVRHKYLGEGFGYLRIAQFQARTAREVREAIIKLKDSGNLNGLIIDLRNNPGGLLSQAIKITDFFLDNGEIVSTKSRKASENRKWFAKSGDLTNGKTIIVLINYGSASASEIVAGALKDHKRAILLGENSYGKGSVQSIIPLRNGGGMRLTISKYYLHSGKSISEVGVSPDILVEEKGDSFKINTDTDNQLEYAINLLRS